MVMCNNQERLPSSNVSISRPGSSSSLRRGALPPFFFLGGGGALRKPACDQAWASLSRFSLLSPLALRTPNMHLLPLFSSFRSSLFSPGSPISACLRCFVQAGVLTLESRGAQGVEMLRRNIRRGRRDPDELRALWVRRSPPLFSPSPPLLLSPLLLLLLLLLLPPPSFSPYPRQSEVIRSIVCGGGTCLFATIKHRLTSAPAALIAQAKRIDAEMAKRTEFLDSREGDSGSGATAAHADPDARERATAFLSLPFAAFPVGCRLRGLLSSLPFVR